MLDPYHKWLGIPQDRRPPSVYDLLGLSPGERDPEVIDAAVVRQSAYVRNFQAGRYSNEATRLLNEIAEAREVLSDPERRRDYDASLPGARTSWFEPSRPTQCPPISHAIPPPANNRGGRRRPGRFVAAGVAVCALAILAIVLSVTRTIRPRSTTHPASIAESGTAQGSGGASRTSKDQARPDGSVGPESVTGATRPSDADPSERRSAATPGPQPAGQEADLAAKGEPVAPNVRSADPAPRGKSEAPIARPSPKPAESSDQDRYYERIAAAQRELRDGDAAGARNSLDRCSPSLRGWEWHYLLRQCTLARGEGRTDPDRIQRLRDRAVAGLSAEIPPWDEGRVLRGHASWVSSAKFSPDDRLVATGSGDGSVKIWEATTGKLLKTLAANQMHVLGVAFSPSGLRVAAAGSDAAARVWDVRSGNLLATLRGHGMPLTEVAYRADGKRIATASKDGTIRTWDATSFKALATLKVGTGIVEGLSYSPDGRRIASTSEDGLMRVSDADDGRILLTLRGHAKGCEKVAFSPDGRRIASTSKDGTVRLWDAATGKEELILRSHSTQSVGVAFSPDGGRVASAGWDCIKLWDASTGREVLDLAGTQTVAFSHDGRMLLSNHGKGGFEGVVRDTSIDGGPAGADGSPASIPSDDRRREAKDSATGATTGARPRSIPIYRFDHPSDLLLATLPAEVDDLRRKGKYTLAGVVGYGFAEPQPGTVQLWRHFETGSGRHSYSLDRIATPGVLDEGMAVWVYASPRRGTVPVWGVLSDGGTFHVYPEGRP